MATLVLSTAGAALGGALGGSSLIAPLAVAGGRALGALAGRAIDEKLFGSGSAPIARGQVDSFRVMGASDGTPIPRVFGRYRLAPQVIWASNFMETVSEETGGKATSPGYETYSYSLHIALGLCEGEISGIGRIWADGQEVDPADFTIALYHGTHDQHPDPTIEAVEGAGAAPAYRGTAYMVISDLDLTRFGNRVPQFNVEVFRPAARENSHRTVPQIEAVALLPGTGEVSLARTAQFGEAQDGQMRALNQAMGQQATDLVASLDQLGCELPACKNVSLIVSWFGDDLRAAECEVAPRVDMNSPEAKDMPWQVSGVTRATAKGTPTENGRAVYGGTPCDASVVQSIREMHGRGLGVMFYPFVLMVQQWGNSLPDPWWGGASQPALPWRGRITLSAAPGRTGSPDQTPAAADEVAAFFGSAEPGDFTISGDEVVYSGPQEFGYRRFILHYANLCKAAGGVEAFCVGSEMRGLTEIRSGAFTFPAVEQFIQLVHEVRAILGPACKISYAADWSEYHGIQPPGGDKLFHLDALWADDDVDFIGIDNYMPLSDWRQTPNHADADWGSRYALPYLRANVSGGEGYDWYYASDADRDAQIRSPIDDWWGQDFIWRYKDLKGWWENPHHHRVNGAPQAAATPWVPMSKPIWFTEFGCAAIDQGPNQPNKFLDPKSSESALPYYSNGQTDLLAQRSYYEAIVAEYNDAQANPVSPVYGAPMLDLKNCYAWAWDARPYPAFPARGDLWGDAENYLAGHWLNGRAGAVSLSDLVAELCDLAGLRHYDVSGLYGVVRGFHVGQVQSVRAMLEPLIKAFDITIFERDGRLHFTNRSEDAGILLDPEAFVEAGNGPLMKIARGRAIANAAQLDLSYIDPMRDFQASVVTALSPEIETAERMGSDLPLVLMESEAREMARAWLLAGNAAQISAEFAVPDLTKGLHAGASFRVEGYEGLFRADRLTFGPHIEVQATRILPRAAPNGESLRDWQSYAPRLAEVPVSLYTVDVPNPERKPTVYAVAKAYPWPGEVRVLGRAAGESARVMAEFARPATAGVLDTAFDHAATTVDVRLDHGALQSVADLSGAPERNLAAIGTPGSEDWEMVQFLGAELIAPQLYRLTGLLRERMGTRGIAPAQWASGTQFVAITPDLPKLKLAEFDRDLSRALTLSNGPARRPPTDATWRSYGAMFRGVAYRPWAVGGLSLSTTETGVSVSWVPQSGIAGNVIVPEALKAEWYRVQVCSDAGVLREVVIYGTSWEYSLADQSEDADAAIAIEVRAENALYGAGPPQRIAIL